MAYLGNTVGPQYTRTIGENTTYTVASSGGDFTTVGAAYDSLDDAFIEAGVTVTISVGAGTFVESTINLDHPQGQRINITGAGSGSTTLSFSADGNDGFYCENNRSGTIDALTILSTSTTKYGVWANTNGAILLGTDVIVDGWRTGIYARDHSFVEATSVTVDDATTYSVHSTTGSTIRFLSGSITQTSVNGSQGIRCEGSSIVFAGSCSIQGASRTGQGVFVVNAGFVDVSSADIDNGTNCLFVNGLDTCINASSANLNGASSHNVSVGHGIVFLYDATNTNSGGYGVSCSNNGKVYVAADTTSGHSSGDYSLTLNTAASDGALIYT